MKAITIALSFLAVVTAYGVTPSGQPVSGSVTGSNNSYIIQAGNSASIIGSNCTIYVYSGATLSELVGSNCEVYYEAGASIGQTVGSNNSFQQVSFGSGDSPSDGLSTFSPGDNIDDWVYFGPWPWVYISNGGWAYLLPTEDGLYVFAVNGNTVLLLNE